MTESKVLIFAVTTEGRKFEGGRGIYRSVQRSPKEEPSKFGQTNRYEKLRGIQMDESI